MRVIYSRAGRHGYASESDVIFIDHGQLQNLQSENPTMAFGSIGDFTELHKEAAMLKSCRECINDSQEITEPQSTCMSYPALLVAEASPGAW